MAFVETTECVNSGTSITDNRSGLKRRIHTSSFKWEKRPIKLETQSGSEEYQMRNIPDACAYIRLFFFKAASGRTIQTIWSSQWGQHLASKELSM